MTEEAQEAIEEAPQEEMVADNDAEQPQDDAPQDADGADEEAKNAQSDADDGEDVEFPKKAVNALNRKNKQINKLRAQMRELEARLAELPKETKPIEVDETKYDTWEEYNAAKVEALVDQKTQQSQSELQKQQLAQQKEILQAQRAHYMQEQVQEASKTLTDLPSVIHENVQLLDSMPTEIADIFYSIDHAPAAIYALAKEGKLDGLQYANPAVAAYEIVNAQNRGLALMSKPKTQVSQAPTPISKAKGTGSVKKQLSPNDDVLKSLGLKR